MSKIDITGHRFGNLVAIRPTDKRNKSRSIIWNCLCDCGKTCEFPANNLRSGHSKSCGCSRYTVTDITGRQFGRLIAVRPTNKMSSSRCTIWKCICNCGNTCEVPINRLQFGDTQSCGCLRVVHGKTGTSEYSAWTSMIQRCLNQNHPRFKDWGGRGIKICEYLRSQFENFYADLGDKPTSDHSIDRYPNNDGNYSCGHCDECKRNDWPKNIRWATGIEQAENKRPWGSSI